MKYKVISLFSGAMGLDIGMELTGHFKLLACVEKEKIFSDTIELNRSRGALPKQLKIYNIDIKQLDPKTLMKDLDLNPGDLDVLVGGPPCQAFSTAGKRASVQDVRGTLLWDYLRFVEVLKPKMFLMENVRGLLSAALKHRPIELRPEKGGEALEADEMPGSVVKLYSEDLKRIKPGYHLDCFEVNSVNYGAPQIRERAIFIGNRFGELIDFPNPTHVSPVQIEGVEDQVALQLFEDVEKSPWRSLRDVIGDLKEVAPEVMDFSPRKLKILSMVPEGSNWRSLPTKVQQETMGGAFFAKGGRSGWWRRLTFDLPSPTLVTMPNHASTALCHPWETRALSVREYARVQEFPDEWEFAGKTSEKYTQIGNAVPTRLGRVAGELIFAELEKFRKRDWKAMRSKIEDFRRIYIQSHVRTRSWFKNGKATVWNEYGENSATYSPMKTLVTKRSL